MNKLLAVFLFTGISLAGCSEATDPDIQTEEVKTNDVRSEDQGIEEIKTDDGELDDAQLLNVENKEITKDFIAQYKTAKSQGDERTACEKAGYITAFYTLNDAKHKQWKAIEQKDCYGK